MNLELIYGGCAMAKVKCFKCSKEFDDNEMLNYEGRLVCEDCYLDIMSMPKVCDPWAVHAAKKHKNSKLTELQENILKILKENPPLTIEEICNMLNISQEDFRRNFATLRHLELAKGTKVGDKVCYTVF
jgi:DNA-directed RNA polymerase subunit RPC12/RpoP